MNKHHYKVIFSRVLNQPVAEGQNSTALNSQNSTALTLSLETLCFGLMLVLGWVSLSESALAAPNPVSNAVSGGKPRTGRRFNAAFRILS
jgi:hypothetical protein